MGKMSGASTKDMLTLINETERPAYEAELDEVINTLFPDPEDGLDVRLDEDQLVVYYRPNSPEAADNGYVEYAWLMQIDDEREYQRRFYGTAHGRLEGGQMCLWTPDTDGTRCQFEDVKIEPDYLRHDGGRFFRMTAHDRRIESAYYAAGLGGVVPVALTRQNMLPVDDNEITKGNWTEFAIPAGVRAWNMGIDHGREMFGEARTQSGGEACKGDGESESENASP